MLGSLKLIKLLYYFEKVTFPNQYNINKNIKKDGSSSKNILIINTEQTMGGGETYYLNLCKNLLKEGYNVKLLIAKDSELEKSLKELKISYYTYKKYTIFKTAIQPGFYSAIYKICEDDKIDILHCNLHRETIAAKKVAQSLPVKVVLTRHSPQKIKSKYIENLDGFIGVNPEIVENAKYQNLNIKHFEFIPPIFNEEKLINFNSTETKKDFFKNNFGIEIKDLPILCMVANMPKDINHKNHPLLLQAINKLIYEKNKPVELMLVGDGDLKPYLKNLIKDLKIEKYVHLLGFTDKAIEIMFHSDIKVLSSKNEAFGIVLLEAALLKKPIICANKIGAADILIQNNRTGLLFENDNVNSLTEKIEILLDNKELQKTLGENAYQHVLNNFSANAIIQKIEFFYDKVMAN